MLFEVQSVYMMMIEAADYGKDSFFIPVKIIGMLDDGIAEVVGFDAQTMEWDGEDDSFACYLDDLNLDRGEALRFVERINEELNDD
jgi:hypothetical protein